MYFVFDIGGTNMRLAVSADGISISNSKIVPTPTNFNEGIRILKQVAGELSRREKIDKVAGGIAGPLDKEKTMLVASAHVGGWVQKPLKEELEKAFGCRVYLENDTAIEGLGEAIKGSGAGKNIVAYITIGTGVGGVRVVDGKIDKNALGFEPGHQIIMPDGNPCTCGGKGHLETYVSGSYFEKLYGEKGEDIHDPGIWDEISKYLAIGLTNVAVHWSPDIIILGGSVTKSIPIDKVASYLKQYLTVFSEPPQIIKASLGDKAGLHGALHLLTLS